MRVSGGPTIVIKLHFDDGAQWWIDDGGQLIV